MSRKKRVKYSEGGPKESSTYKDASDLNKKNPPPHTFSTLLHEEGGIIGKLLTPRLSILKTVLGGRGSTKNNK